MWLRGDLARHLATILDADTDTAPTGAAVVAEIDRLAALAEARCVALGPEPDTTTRHRADGRPVTEHVTDRRFTTPLVLDQEHDLHTWAAANTRPVEPAQDPHAATSAAIAGWDPVVLVVGPAGTGKTTATARAVASLHADGPPVVGLAPSGKAADVLAREAGCPTDTVAGFLTRHRGRPSPWPAETTVILDEAGMSATADLARLVELVRANRWRLAAVGDPHQRPSVARGGRVRLLVRHPSDPHPRRTPALHPTMGSRRQPPPACRAPRRRRGLRRPRSRSRHPPGARRRPGRPSPPAPRRRGAIGGDHRDQRRDRPRHQPGDPMSPQEPRPRRRTSGGWRVRR